MMENESNHNIDVDEEGNEEPLHEDEVMTGKAIS